MRLLAFVALLPFLDASNVPRSNNLPCIRYKEMIPTYACSYQVNDHASNINWLASVLGCLSCKGHLEVKSIQGVKKFCQINGGVELSQERVQSAYQKFIHHKSNSSSTASPNVNTTIDHPILLHLSEVELYKKAYEKYLGNFDDSIYYGTAIYGYWLVVIVIAALANWGEGVFTSFSNTPWVRLIHKYLVLPALMTKSKSQVQSLLGPVQFILPSRLEALILALFFILSTTVTLMNTGPVDGDPIYYTKNNAQLRYVVDRSGIISTMLAPLVVLFAGRNNLLIWITRWQYERFQTFHRWLARSMVVLGLVHAIGYTKLLSIFFYSEIKTVYLKAGVVAMVASIVMVLQGVLCVRRRWYEMFLIVHIVLGVCWLVGCWLHVNELGFVYFFYPVAAVWGIDMLARIVRLMFFGFPMADFYLVADDLIRIDIAVPKSWQNRDTIGHAFIYIFQANCFWQSHPFTWFYDELKALEGTSVVVKVYLTGASSSWTEKGTLKSGPIDEKRAYHEDAIPQSEQSSSSDDESKLNNLSFIEFLYGRPDISQLVATNIEECQTSVAFITCGHPRMVDDLRFEVCQRINAVPGKTVYFYNQLQVWA
ncbi:hypothetical protein I9W82_004948 [Candida metapsilosis]|uniref:FAD-binding FR-type domain-containing protein n=1 Tax=Candida metapsilosis TaxID=273372 RepID=A0A8H7ZDA6_9ASCO|nr:hypothetical protein I9W82_004948 [Candida metapsilosis]